MRRLCAGVQVSILKISASNVSALNVWVLNISVLKIIGWHSRYGSIAPQPFAIPRPTTGDQPASPRRPSHSLAPADPVRTGSARRQRRLPDGAAGSAPPDAFVLLSQTFET